MNALKGATVGVLIRALSLHAFLRRHAWSILILHLTPIVATLALLTRLTLVLATVLLLYDLSLVISWTREYVNGRLPYGRFVLVALAATTILAFVFANLHFLLFESSTYVTENYRVAETARIGGAAERIFVRRYLQQKMNAYEQYWGRPPDMILPRSSMANIARVAHAAKAAIGQLLDLQLPSSTREGTDPLKLAGVIHELALESQAASAYYRTGTVTPLGYEGVLERQALVEWQKLPPELQGDAQLYDVVVYLAIGWFLDKMGQVRPLEEERQLYLAFLLFSSLIFMTVGFGDISANSLFAFTILFVQILAYIVAFVLLIPLGLDLVRRPRPRQ